MLYKRRVIIAAFFVFTLALIYIKIADKLLNENDSNRVVDQDNLGGPLDELHPLTIEALRQGEYPGSDLTLEQQLTPGVNYKRYIASYKSESLMIYGLLTIPSGSSPTGGWPAIIFNHGYISPSVYRTTEKYVAYQDAFARAGFVTFKSDYRGHGNSEGEALGGYGSNGYTIDVLNALSSIKRYKGVDSERIGMWGHSMGGHITLESMVVSGDIKAGVIWAGVVGSYPDLLTNWRRRNVLPSPGISSTRRWRDDLVSKYGQPGDNPRFWDSISANNYLADISGPLQLHHGTADASVPLEFSKTLEAQMKAVGKEVEFYTYEGDDHNFSRNLSLALRRSVEFFDTILKH